MYGGLFPALNLTSTYVQNWADSAGYGEYVGPITVLTMAGLAFAWWNASTSNNDSLHFHNSTVNVYVNENCDEEDDVEEEEVEEEIEVDEVENSCGNQDCEGGDDEYWWNRNNNEDQCDEDNCGYEDNSASCSENSHDDCNDYNVDTWPNTTIVSGQETWENEGGQSWTNFN